MAKKQIRHVPVKSNREVIGIVVAEDILELLGSAAQRPVHPRDERREALA
jgi:signal-transduction protein with cAMP-binding, CBS, and nucleotidyltransferase domain